MQTNIIFFKIVKNIVLDPEKQKSGRLSQKKAFSAAVSAAPIEKKEEIIIDNEGNAVGIGTTPPLPLSTRIDDRFTPSENNNIQDLLAPSYGEIQISKKLNFT